MSAIDSLAASCAELQLADVRKPGVYVLIHCGVVQYVGESNNVLSRVGQHSRSFDFDRILYFKEENKRERRALEGALARRFAPPMASVFSARDIDRDAEILSRFGLSPDADNARLVAERTSACWSEETKARVREDRKRHREHREKQRARFARRGIPWTKNWHVRGRSLARHYLWNALKPALEAKAS